MIKFGLALSLHLLGGDMNFFHPYIKFQHENFIAGAYYNSEQDISAFVGVEWGKLEIGLVTGYSGGDILPFFRYVEPVNDNLYFFAAPDVRTNGDVGVTLGVGTEW